MNDISITRHLHRKRSVPRFFWQLSSAQESWRERLAGGNVAIASAREHRPQAGAGLVALILTFGPVSGAHFNPAVTLADAAMGGLAWRDVLPYMGAQVFGAFIGRGRSRT